MKILFSTQFNIKKYQVFLYSKDILKFHSVYWIGFLLSANLPLPRQIIAHGWWLSGGVKMAKTLGNIIDPNAIADKYGNDVLRYVLLRDGSFSNDCSFTEEILINRLNADLADNLGNFVSRCLGKKLNPSGKVPKRPDFSDFIDSDKKIMTNLMKTVQTCNHFMRIPDIQNYIASIWGFISDVNNYITEEKPWKLIKENDGRFLIVHYNILECLRTIAVMISPILPDTSKKNFWIFKY